MSDLTNDKASRRNLWRAAGWGAAVLLLLVPLIAMQFTDEVAWGGEDFIFAAIMFVLVGIGLELASRHPGGRPYFVASALAILASFLTIWINLAVGIIGNEGNPMNLMFFGVLVIALGSAILARLQPGGMAKAMVATAIAQAIVFLAALLMGEFIPGVSLFFGGLWLIAAVFYHRAASRHIAD